MVNNQSSIRQFIILIHFNMQLSSLIMFIRLRREIIYRRVEIILFTVMLNPVADLGGDAGVQWSPPFAFFKL